MSHPWHHARSSVRRFGGKPSDYLGIHNWFDETKSHLASWQHRALRHHSLGIFDCEKVFGTIITNSDGVQVPVRQIGEQHVVEDLGMIPTPGDWLLALGNPKAIKGWMTRGVDISFKNEPSLLKAQPNSNESTRLDENLSSQC
jgi:hypothetical protein